MARSRGKKGSEQRGDISASSSLSDTLDDLLLSPVLPLQPITLSTLALEGDLTTGDRRRYHPERAQRPALSFPTNIPARLKARLSPRLEMPGYEAAKFVTDCVRRKQRREVMFAKKRTGKGSRAFKRHFSWRSFIKC